MLNDLTRMIDYANIANMQYLMCFSNDLDAFLVQKAAI